MNRRRAVSLGVGASLGVPLLRKALAPDDSIEALTESWHTKIHSHSSFDHDSIDSLGYDWGRIGEPWAEPCYPRKIYLPQSEEDVVRAVNEARSLGEQPRVRGKGHSSNNLVVTPDSVILTEKFNRIIGLDENNETVTVEAGTVLSQLDGWLARKGYGLPIIGDHKHVSAGGFASVGGFSPAAHVYGMFADNVEQLRYVDWEGNVVSCSRTQRPDDFYKVLTGQGRFGVITQLTLRVMRVDKFRTVLETDRTMFRRFEAFLEASDRVMRDPGDALFVRCLWLHRGLPGGRAFNLGSVALHRPTTQSRYGSFRDRSRHFFSHGLGVLAGGKPEPVERVLQGLGVMSVFFTAKYASIKNVEAFIDPVTDYSAVDPNRFVILWLPLENWQRAFVDSYGLLRDADARHNCFTFFSSDSGPFRSAYLAHGDATRPFVEIIWLLGMDRERMTKEILSDVISQLDDLTIANQGYRYMHTLTVSDPQRRALVDPNTYYAEKAEGRVPVPGE